MDEIPHALDGEPQRLVKTLEEPPPHVKFIFSRHHGNPKSSQSQCCVALPERFDLRRVEAATSVSHLSMIAGLEKVTIDDASLAMIAAEGSVRDSLSIMDQAIAHGSGKVEALAEAVRSMLGLAEPFAHCRSVPQGHGRRRSKRSG